MAIKLPDFLKNFSNLGARSRVLFIIMTVVLVGTIIFIGVSFFGGGAQTTGPSKVAAAPRGIQSVPGAQMSPEFYRAVSEANVQAAQQAQITGTSAVPTLINVPGEQPVTVMQQSAGCCNPEAVDVATEINKLVKEGKLSPENGSNLLAMAKDYVCVDTFADALDDYVKQSKITPEQARQLLDCYKRQYKNHLLSAGAASIDEMIKAGQLSLSVANQLLALQKSDILPNDYSAELNQLTKDNKLSKTLASQLLTQYSQQTTQEQSKNASCLLSKMAKLGQIAPEVATNLDALQKRNASVEDYAAELARLVAAGKITPEMASRLLAQYRAQQGQMGASAAVGGMISKEEAVEDATIDALLNKAKITEDSSNQLKTSMRGTRCPSVIDNLVKEKKLMLEDTKELTPSCQKLISLRELQDQLSGANVAKCTESLKASVRVGAITPEEATALLQQCRASAAAKAGLAVGPGGTNVPGGADFAKLQQRLQIAEGATPPEEVQFQAAPAESPQAESQRTDRLNQMITNMSNQAGQLISAWQPPAMQHMAGAPEEKETPGSKEEAEKEGKSSDTSGASNKPPLVKAGTIYFAVLDTGVNSDYPDTPVMATIIQGPFKGAKLLGKMQVSSGKDKVSLSFNLMNMDSWTNSKTINAFAIDPDTARTVMASDVDNHYLKRYGALFASSFLSGYASAISQGGTTTTTGIFGTSSTTPPLSPSSKIAVALGKVGDALGNSVQGYSSTPPTVTVNSGVGIGILFMSDLSQTSSSSLIK